MHIKYQAQFATLFIRKKKKEKLPKNMLLKNKNYNKVNATLDNRNQKKNIFLKFYIKKKAGHK